MISRGKKITKKTLHIIYQSYFFRILRRLISSQLEKSIKHCLINYRWIQAIEEEFKLLINRIESLEPVHKKMNMNYLLASLVEAVLSQKSSFKDIFQVMVAQPLDRPSEKLGLSSGSNILFVTSVFPSLNHGGGLRVFDMIHELSLRGMQVYLFSVHQDENDNTLDALKSHLKGFQLVSGGDFHSQKMGTWLREQNIQFSAGYFLWPDSVNLMSGNREFISHKIFEYIEVTTRRVWMDIQMAVHSNNLAHLYPKFWEFLHNYYFEKKAILEADTLVCLTEKDSEFVQTVFMPKKVEIIKTGLSRHVILDKAEKVKSAVRENTVGFIGNYDHYPNLDGVSWYLKNIHPLVLSQVPNYKFIVIGRGPLEKIKQEFAMYSDSVIWTGPVDDVVQSILGLEICAAPLVSGAGLRGKINQYAALKKPIVSTSIGACGTPYVDGQSAFIEDDPKIYAEKLIALLKDKNLGRQMGDSAYHVVQENFLWKNSIDQLIAVL